MNQLHTRDTSHVGRAYSSAYRACVLVLPFALMIVLGATIVGPGNHFAIFASIEPGYDVTLAMPLVAPWLARRVARR